MNPKTTKIFGLAIPIQQNYLLAGMLAIVVGIGLYNFMGGSDEANANSARSALKRSTVSPASNQSASVSARRAELANRNKQEVLRVKAVDPSQVVDPTLKLTLLARVREVKPLESARNLFELGPDPAKPLPPLPQVAKMTPKPLPPTPVPVSGPPPPPQVNIPLRYYGFVRPSLRSDGNRGYFMDGDNILMATEGDVLESRFLVVALSPNTARLEDIQLKQGQDLQLIPEAVVTP